MRISPRPTLFALLVATLLVSGCYGATGGGGGGGGGADASDASPSDAETPQVVEDAGDAGECGSGELLVELDGQQFCAPTCSRTSDCRAGAECIDETFCFRSESGPAIGAALIDPSTVSQSETGMTDECFTVEMTITGFDAPIAEVTIFIVEDDSRSVTATEGTPECAADASPKFQAGDTQIAVGGIPKPFVSGLGVGAYGIGATITDTEGNQVTERNITTLEIVE